VKAPQLYTHRKRLNIDKVLARAVVQYGSWASWALGWDACIGTLRSSAAPHRKAPQQLHAQLMPN